MEDDLPKWDEKGQGADKETTKSKGSQSLLPNLLAMIGRTSSASTRVSRKGSKEISAESDGSSNQLLIGIPLFTCNRNTWNHGSSLSIIQNSSTYKELTLSCIFSNSNQIARPTICKTLDTHKLNKSRRKDHLHLDSQT